MNKREATRQAHRITARQLESFLQSYESPDDMPSAERTMLEIELVKVLLYHSKRAGIVDWYWLSELQQLEDQLELAK